MRPATAYDPRSGPTNASGSHRSGLRRGRPQHQPLARLEPPDRVGRPELDERQDEVPHRAQEPDLEPRRAERERERRHERLREARHDRRERRLAARDGEAPGDLLDAGRARSTYSRSWAPGGGIRGRPVDDHLRPAGLKHTSRDASSQAMLRHAPVRRLRPAARRASRSGRRPDRARRSASSSAGPGPGSAANGKLYRLCWENLLQSCRLSSTGFPPEPTCTFPCGSDADCGFGRRCVVQQCIPPPALRLTPRRVCRVLCSESVFPLCEARRRISARRPRAGGERVRWCRDSAPDYECNSGCGTALEATGDPCVFNRDVAGTCSGGTCYERIACDSDAQCSWTNGETGTCVAGQCVPGARRPRRRRAARAASARRSRIRPARPATRRRIAAGSTRASAGARAGCCVGVPSLAAHEVRTRDSRTVVSHRRPRTSLPAPRRAGLQEVVSTITKASAERLKRGALVIRELQRGRKETQRVSSFATAVRW